MFVEGNNEIVGKKYAGEIDSDTPDEDRLRLHIGKRSAAGLYCWDCRETLCKDGEAGIHHSCGHNIGCRCRWFDSCPNCGNVQQKNSYNPVMVELGFSPAAKVPPTGIAGALSFGFAQQPDWIEAVCGKFPDEPIIKNEYGDLFTGAEFLALLEAGCPIRKTSSIGKWFM